MPPSEFYDPDGMSSEGREKFIKWYDEKIKSRHHFNFWEEMDKYCTEDVRILRKCSIEFRRLFRETTNVDAFSCITIASACNKVFRKNFLQKDTIWIIPPQGYRSNDVQSTKAIKWLEWQSHVRGTHIQHSRNGGEHVVFCGPQQYKVDGYYEEGGEKVALEFLGCFHHGHLECYKPESVNPLNDMTMKELFMRTKDRIRVVEQQGYRVESVWECEYDRSLKDNEEMKAFVNDIPIKDPLKPRDAFYGGRTNATKLKAECGLNETIKYYDITSLYPWVNKYCAFPVGHPEIILQDFKEILEYFGLIKCRVLPPRRLYHPVLPYRSEKSKKLLFPLCRTCAEQSNQERCTHSDDERALEGTWVTLEVQEAQKLNYKIEKIEEVWHWAVQSEYDPETKSGGLFTSYIDTFLRIKQESSGYPSEDLSEEDKNEYVENYFQKEGVR